MNRIRPVLVVLALVAAGCGGDDGPGRDQARLDVDGSATVTSADGAVEVVTGGATLGFGDVVVVDQGTASLELAAGQRYELRGGETPSEVVVGSPPTLVAGDALISSGFPAAMTHDTVTVTAQGAAKLQASVPSVTSYAGRTRVNGAGALGEVLGLRHAVLTPSAVPEPITYDAADEWDRLFLGEAIAFGERLEALARGYTGDLGPSGGRTASFFEAVMPALAEEREFGADLVGDRPPGETLVGAAIAVQGRNGTFRERWGAIFAFRDAGAAWGLVALDQGVSSAPVLETLELAIEDPPATAPPPPSTTNPPTTASTTTTTTTTDDGTTTTTTATTSTTTTTTPPDGGPLAPILEPVGQLLDEILDALGLG